MKYRHILLDQLKLQPFFDKSAVRHLSEQYGLKSPTLDAYISQSIKRKEILPLRKGLYVPAEFYLQHKDDISYRFYLANVLRKPSYVSSWTALQYYNLTTEVIHSTTSVTQKLTRDYRTKVGSFAYQSMKAALFTGFALEKGTFEFFIASPAKALFDLLYFRTRQLRGVTVAHVDRLVEELRIDIEEMAVEERHTFNTLIRNHLRHE